MGMLETPRALFALWPSLEAASDDFKADGHDISATAISKWCQRGRIGPEYWVPLVRIAERHGFTEITFEALATMHALPDGNADLAEARA